MGMRRRWRKTLRDTRHIGHSFRKSDHLTLDRISMEECQIGISKQRCLLHKFQSARRSPPAPGSRGRLLSAPCVPAPVRRRDPARGIRRCSSPHDRERLLRPGAARRRARSASAQHS